MRFEPTPIPGACVIELDRIEDERGWFSRTFDAEAFLAHGLDPTVVQSNASFTKRRDTVRGMHYQAAPHGEAKLVRCVRGASFDVAVDLRPDSPTYCGWHAVLLSAENRRSHYLPVGVAHGFQTLVDDCEVIYQMGNHHVASATRGVRWDDPAFAIRWPTPQLARIISERDLAYPDYRSELG